MKKLLFLLLFTTSLIYGQIPQGISHRGTVYTTVGTTTTIVASTQVKIKVSILEGTSVVYSEIHLVTTNSQGQYSLNIGTSTTLDSPNVAFNTINWGSSGNKYLKIDIALPVSTNPYTYPSTYSISGSNQLMSVPYALYSQSSGDGIKTVAKIEDLLNIASPSNNMVVYVKGYFAEGDGGEGTFIYQSNNSKPTNLGTIFKTISNTTTPPAPGRWIRQYSGYMNVEYFGVQRDWDHYSDPGFSNSDRIQNMIDYATTDAIYSKEADLTIFFPDGQYFIDKPIILKDKVKLLGSPGTLLTNVDKSYNYMFELGSGIVNKLRMENFMINPNKQKGVGGIHLKASPPISGGVEGGLWDGVFRNINIINSYGTCIYLEGGELYNTGKDAIYNYNLPNQFIIFDNVRTNKFTADAYGLKITGQNANYTFLNCEFLNDPATHADGTCVFISSLHDGTTLPIIGSQAMSFINCGFGGAPRYGAIIQNSQNITFDTCYLERADITFNIRDCNQISIINTRFANGAGCGGSSESHTSGIGSCIQSENSIINVENNYVACSDNNSPLIANQFFIQGVGNNNVINAKNNSFTTPGLGKTYGIMQTVPISSVSYSGGSVTGIDISSKKLVFIQSTGDIYRINSTINAGETIVLRANAGSITFYPMNPTTGTVGRNIYLSGKDKLILNSGETATFIKIDNIVGNENATYQLVSLSNNDVEVSNWRTDVAFSSPFSSYDANSTVRYRKKNGIVYLDGNIKGGATQVNGTGYMLFRLPEGNRPARKESFAIVRAGNAVSGVPTTTVVGRIDIDSDGFVYGVNYSNVWNSLSGIQFFTD